MSGSFRVLQNGGDNVPGQFHLPRSEDRAHDHVVFHMSSGASVVFNDPRRSVHEDHCPQALRGAAAEGARSEPLGNEFRRFDAGRTPATTRPA